MAQPDRRRRAGAGAEPWKAGGAKAHSVELAKKLNGRASRTTVQESKVKNAWKNSDSKAGDIYAKFEF